VLGLVFVLGKEEHAHRQRLAGTKRVAGLCKKIVARDGGLDTDSIAAFAVGGNGATVGEAAERGQGETQDFVFGTAVQGRNEADTAGVMLEAGV